MNASDRKLFLAAGLQSGGTTLISWCFLQRADMDGVLDLPHDRLMPIPAVSTRLAWAKATIASFHFDEIASYYRWSGWEVKPLLVVRNPFDVYRSLSNKWYGFNGTTSDDPPLLVRFSRFLADWRLFRDRQWPIVQHEALIATPEITLRDTCCALGIDWDPAMLDWPKARNSIADATSGNETFLSTTTQENGIAGSLQRYCPTAPSPLSREVETWIADQFSEFNSYHNYKDAIQPDDDPLPESLPVYSGTRHQKLMQSLTELQTRLEQTSSDLARVRSNLKRLTNHPVIGPVVRAWIRMANPSLRTIFDD
ncbi:MAG: hypothetical protein KDG50_09580 [Chromatiales bacterium]|nr:hypothetical protein [Chromatiales bacterium]